MHLDIDAVEAVQRGIYCKAQLLNVKQDDLHDFLASGTVINTILFVLQKNGKANWVFDILENEKPRQSAVWRASIGVALDNFFADKEAIQAVRNGLATNEKGREHALALFQARDKARAALISYVSKAGNLPDDILVAAGIYLSDGQRCELKDLRQRSQSRCDVGGPT